MSKKTKNEVLGVKAPKETCTDKKCPFHGQIAVKKEFFTGKVIKKDVSHSATLEWSRSVYIPKYERYEYKRSRMRAHNPACINAQIGQKVLVAKTRPLSKMKDHVILKVIEDEITVTKEPQKTEENESVKQ
tara:strand:+ start:683 stop:1075 length:393 start_codon:yes stop_codon:yes gene_type:complete